MSIKTTHLQFLDIRSDFAPNYSYDAFIKAYKCKLKKGFFPYGWLAYTHFFLKKNAFFL